MTKLTILLISMFGATYPISVAGQSNCVSSANWRMGDATENSYGGRLINSNDGQQRFFMEPAPRDVNGNPENEVIREFHLSSSITLSEGVYSLNTGVLYAAGEDRSPIDYSVQITKDRQTWVVDPKDYQSVKLVIPKEPLMVTISLVGRSNSEIAVGLGPVIACRRNNKG